MTRVRLSLMSLLPLALAACEPAPPASTEKVPMEGGWEKIVDRAIFEHNTDPVLLEQLAGVGLVLPHVTYLSVGKAAGQNLVNRGHVEIIYAEDHNGEIVGNNFDNAPVISVEIRKFTTAEDEEEMDANLLKSSLYAYTISPGDTYPTEDMLPSWCVQQTPALPDAGIPALTVWSESCYLTVAYDGLSQPLRDGADLRITVPADWRGLVEVVTSDDIQDAEVYPRRSNVTIKDLAGDAKVTLESGEAKVRLAADYLEVTTCDEAGHEDCRDARWNTNDAGGCIDADGEDDDGHCGNSDNCAADPLCMVDNCLCNPDNFGSIQIKTQDLKAANIFVDLPSHLWTAAKLQNNEPSLAPNSDPLCKAQLECDEFDACEIDEANSDNEWKRYVELNDLGDDNVEGLGIQVNVESDACAYVPVARTPEDYEAPVSEKRGDLTVCNGCLADL